MRVTSIAATDVLSFRQLDLDVPDGLSVIVGPNGSGKTNLGRLVRFAAAAVRAAATNGLDLLDAEWSLAGRYGSRRFEVRVGLEFDQDGERSIIEDWARAAVLSAFQLSDSQIVARLDGLLSRSIDASALLARGQLVIRHDDRWNVPWVVYWQTADPVAHLELRQGHVLAPGPVTEETGRVSSRSRPQEVLHGLDGSRLPDNITTHIMPPDWEGSYAPALASFALADLLGAPSPVEMVARRSFSDPELPALRQLMYEFRSLGEGTQGYLNFAQILDRLMSSTLAVTNSRRVPVLTVAEDSPGGALSRPRASVVLVTWPWPTDCRRGPCQRRWVGFDDVALAGTPRRVRLLHETAQARHRSRSGRQRAGAGADRGAALGLPTSTGMLHEYGHAT